MADAVPVHVFPAVKQGEAVARLSMSIGEPSGKAPGRVLSPGPRGEDFASPRGPFRSDPQAEGPEGVFRRAGHTRPGVPAARRASTKEKEAILSVSLQWYKSYQMGGKHVPFGHATWVSPPGATWARVACRRSRSRGLDTPSCEVSSRLVSINFVGGSVDLGLLLTRSLHVKEANGSVGPGAPRVRAPL